MDSLLNETSARNREEGTIPDDSVAESTLMASKNTCRKEGHEESPNTGDLVMDKNIKGHSHVKYASAETENEISLVLSGSECLASDERVAVVDTQDRSMELDKSNESDVTGDKICDVLVAGEISSKSMQSQQNKPPYDASSWITSDRKLVERRQDNMEEATLLSSEATALSELIFQPGSGDTKLVPDKPPSGSNKRKLLVLDINGLLADIVPVAYISDRYRPEPDAIVAGKAVYKRPFCDEFLEFCFGKFNVGVWSSRTKRNVTSVLDLLMGEVKHNLLFCWDQSHCTHTSYNTPGNPNKPLVFKNLNKLWENSENDLPWKRGDYDKSNTLLLDDSPYKALLNPPNTAIFPHTYQYRIEGDNSLGPDGDLRIYLEGLTMASNVQEYVVKNPFGQQPITEKDASWSFYHEVIESTSQSLESPVKLQNDASKVGRPSVAAEIAEEFVDNKSKDETWIKDLKSRSGLLKVDESDRQVTEESSVGYKSSDYLHSTQRHSKRGRGGSVSRSPVHGRSRSRSRSLSPKRRWRSRSPPRWQGRGFGVGKAGRDQPFREECRNFLRGRCLRGESCWYVHHQPGEAGGSRYNMVNQRHHHVLPSSRSSDVYRDNKTTFSDRSVHDQNEGKVRQLKQDHPVTDFGEGMEGHRKNDNLWERTRRDRAVPRECYDFMRGWCNWGASCRFLHSEPDKTDRSRSYESKQHYQDTVVKDEVKDWRQELGRSFSQIRDRVRGYNASRPECRDYARGYCSWGESCRYLHQEPDQVDRSESYRSHRQNQDFPIRPWSSRTRWDTESTTPRQSIYVREDHVPRLESVNPNHGGNRRYEKGGWQPHDNTRRHKEPTERCYDFTKGRCWREHCRYLHIEPNQYNWSKQEHEDVPWSSKSLDICGKAENIEQRSQEMKLNSPGIEERRDMVEELPKSINQVIYNENFPEGPVLRGADANDMEVLDIAVRSPHASVENSVKQSQVHCSDQMIQDTAFQPNHIQ